MWKRRVAAVILLLATGLAGWAATGLRIDNRLERWFDESGPDGEAYASFRREFGSGEFLFAVIGGGEFFEPTTLEALLAASEEMEATPGIVEVRGIPTVYRDIFGAEDAEALAEEMASPFYRNLFLSGDGQLAGLLLKLAPRDDPAARSAIVARTRAALQPLVDSGREVRLVGSTALIVALDEVSAAESRRTLPLALAGSLLVLAWMLRSFRATLVTSFSAFVSVVLTLGLAAVLGLTMNMVTTTLAPLLWVLALSNSIHVLRRYQEFRRVDSLQAALDRALAETTRPCTLAAITTAAGFASLTVAKLAPLRELGALTAVGILLSLGVNLTLAPVLVEWLRVPAFRIRRSDERVVWWNFGWRGHPKAVLVVFGVLLLASVIAIPLIRAESDPVNFLPKDHVTSRDYRSLNGGFGGFYAAEIVLRAPDTWYASDVWPTIDALAGKVSESPIVSRVLSPVDVLRKLNQWNSNLDPSEYRVPATFDSRGEAIALGGEEARRALDDLVFADGRGVRLSALINEIEENRFHDLVDQVRAFLSELPQGWSGEVTGQVLLLVNAQHALISTQLESLCIALVLVFAIIAMGLRSWRLTMTAVLPNMMPVVAAFALMALLRFPLDAATVMVASVALGIAVDNTVHVLENVRRRCAGGKEVADAVSETLTDIGPAMVATTATACAGFLALSRSEFVPIHDFGLLASAAMVVALVSDTLLLPAILMVRRP